MMAFTQYIVATIHTSNSMVGGMDYDHRSVGLGHQNSAHHSEFITPLCNLVNSWWWKSIWWPSDPHVVSCDRHLKCAIVHYSPNMFDGSSNHIMVYSIFLQGDFKKKKILCFMRAELHFLMFSFFQDISN